MPNHPPTPDGTLDFDSWVRYCFDRETRYWYFEDFADLRDEQDFPRSLDWYSPSSTILCDYATRLFRNAPYLLRSYNPNQLEWGFWYVFGAECGTFYTITDESVPLQTRLGLAESLVPLYRDFFAPLCGNALAHRDEPAPPVANACYMLWDHACLWYREGSESSEVELKQLDVLQRMLSIDSDAVREAALHGLGHAVLMRPSLVEPIIDAFLLSPLVTRGTCRPELVEYAKQARSGNVQ
jgi:hypothetical protein